jgi:acyl-CoA hydrolase
MYFTKPVRPGQILKFTSKVVYTGKSSLVSYIQVTKDETEEYLVSGFITFINVDQHTRPASHLIEIKPVTEEDIALFETAKSLKNK